MAIAERESCELVKIVFVLCAITTYSIVTYGFTSPDVNLFIYVFI